MSELAQSGEGILKYGEPNLTNELLNDSKPGIEDPSAYRGGSYLGSSLVKWSGDRLVGSMRLERTLVICKEIPNGGGQMEFFCQQPGVLGDIGMKRWLTANAQGVTFHVPVAQGDRLTSSNGLFQMIMQADGNLVVYNTSTGRPIWSWMTGPL